MTTSTCQRIDNTLGQVSLEALSGQEDQAWGRLSLHSRESSFREKLVEHLLVGELLKCSWKKALETGGPLIEVSRAEVDRGGYDLIAEFGGCLRHIQLKGSVLGAKTSMQKVHIALGEKPSGCVVWAFFEENELTLGPFLYFGGDPGAPLPSLGEKKVARHTKGDASGTKKPRPNIREVSKGKFTKLETLAELWEALFGA